MTNAMSVTREIYLNFICFLLYGHGLEFGEAKGIIHVPADAEQQSSLFIILIT